MGVEAILMSVISMLSDPNDESPANLDAAVRCSDDEKIRNDENEIGSMEK